MSSISSNTPSPSGDGTRADTGVHESLNKGAKQIQVGGHKKNDAAPSEELKAKKKESAKGEKVSQERAATDTMEAAKKEENVSQNVPTNRKEVLQRQKYNQPRLGAYPLGQSEGEPTREPNPNLSADDLTETLNNVIGISITYVGKNSSGDNLVSTQHRQLTGGDDNKFLYGDNEDQGESESLAGTALFSEGLGSNVYVQVALLSQELIDDAKYDKTVLTQKKMETGFSLQEFANDVEDKLKDAAQKNLQGATFSYALSVAGSGTATLMSVAGLPKGVSESPGRSALVSQTARSTETIMSSTGQYEASTYKKDADIDNAEGQRIQAAMKAMDESQSSMSQSINADTELINSALRQLLQDLKNLGVNIR